MPTISATFVHEYTSPTLTWMRECAVPISRKCRKQATVGEAYNLINPSRHVFRKNFWASSPEQIDQRRKGANIVIPPRSFGGTVPEGRPRLFCDSVEAAQLNWSVGCAGQRMKSDLFAQDHYRVLGVDRNATHGTIREAYLRLVKKHHPDVSKGAQSEEQFKAIASAWEVRIVPFRLNTTTTQVCLVRGAGLKRTTRFGRRRKRFIGYISPSTSLLHLRL